MKATFPKETLIRNAVNMGGTKETIRTMKLVYIDKDGSLNIAVDARFYMGRSKSSSRVYCSVWVTANGYYLSGNGKAGGCGYHKESAALSEAISSQGMAG